MNIERITKTGLLTAAVAGIAGVLLTGISGLALSAAPTPQVAISSVPLTVIVPTHPQVLIALTNSNSMDSSDNVTDDGNVQLTSNAPQSAIMTWSGTTGFATLTPSTSPVNYVIPAGFTPPLGKGSAPTGQAPYNTLIDSYNTSGVNWYGNNWTCSIRNTNPITSSTTYWGYPNGLNQPNNPPTSDPDWPGGVLTWDPTQVWWYNGVDNGSGNAGYYEQPGSPGGITMLWQPSSKLLAANEIPYGISVMSAGSMLLGLSDVSELVSGSVSGGGATPRSGGTIPPACGLGSIPYVVCPPPPPPPLPCGVGPGFSGVPCAPPPPPTYCHLWQWNPPYSVPYNNSYSYQGDNAPSRLNIAKAAISSVISAYGSTADFGLMDYSVAGAAWNQTWAYYMSPPGGFTFTGVYSAPSGGIQYVINPCYAALSAVQSTCNSMLPELQTANPGLTLAQLMDANHEYMAVSARGDDPTINDVFLSNSGGFTGYPVFIEDGAITPPNPYPANYQLSDYNAGKVIEQYSNTAPKIGTSGYMLTFPTNAGYVAYTPQVMYAKRGWLQLGTVNATTGNLLVPMSTAGFNPTPTQVAALVANFTPYMVPENNVPSSDPNYNTFKNAIFSNAGQSPIAGLLSSAASSYGAAPKGPCPPSRYVILMTDGLPTVDLAGNNWPPLGSNAAVGYGVTATFDNAANGDPTGDGHLISTTDQALTDTISQLAALQSAGVKTFVVGMGPGVNPSLNPAAASALTAMAVAGGTTNYFAGSSPAAIVSDLNAILNIISVSNVASVSAATNSSSLNAGTLVYQASYSGYNGVYHDWTGDIQAFAINASLSNLSTYGTVSTTASWSAQCQLDILATGSTGCPSTPGNGLGWDIPTGRLIATWDPTSNTAVPFRLASLDASQQTDLNTDPDTNLADGLGSNRLNYLRGDTSKEIHNGGAFRDRSHILGDIVDSTPLYIGPSNGPYMTDASYQTFVALTASRQPMLYAGANDGMLHAFAAATGVEKFAFIPNGVFSKLNTLTSSTYNLAHQFFVDGAPAAGDVKFASDGKWHTVLVAGLGDGGQSVYALDVTDPSTITNETNLSSHVLWEFTDPNLGFTFSRPVLAKTNVISGMNANPNGFLVFFGSGYNNASGYSGDDYLYALNPETGKPVSSIDLCTATGVPAGTCNSALANGLSSAVVVNSGGNVSLPVDTLYAGDLQGNLWKVDISEPNPANWVVSLLFQARDGSGNPQPITDTPAVSLAPTFPGVAGTVVYFGTGQYLGIPDLTNTNTQSFYAVLDNGTGTTATRAQLQPQVLTTTSVNIGGTPTDIRTITNNGVNWTSQRGWFMDLPLPGERVVTDPRLYNGEVVFTTFVPAATESCNAGGAAFLMAVNYSNGGSFPQPQLDINGDGKLDSSDQVGGLNPVGIGLGQVFASAPAILSASNGAIQAMKLTTLSTPPKPGVSNIKNTGERGGQPGRRAWWQIQ